MTKSSKRLVLVTGGTGNQGGATVKHLLQNKRTRIRVLTRSPDSPKAKHLASLGVELVVGDMDDDASLRRALSGVSAAFSVQGFMDKGGVEAEERRGKAFADAVKGTNVPHLVYSSVDGAERESGVPHFESKWHIESHIRDLGLSRTILRPVAFMENLAASDFVRSLVLGMFRSVLGNEKRVQLVATSDIGWFAARALEDPERYTGREISLAGDELSVPEMVATYRQVTGRAAWVAPVPKFLPRLVMPKEVSLMFQWIGERGYEADIDVLRQEHPTMKTFSAWLKAVDTRN